MAPESRRIVFDTWTFLLKNIFMMTSKALASLASIILVGSFCPGLASAQGTGDGYRFKAPAETATTNPENEPPIKFKVRDPHEAPELADPVNNEPNDTPYITYLGYPKYRLEAVYMPLSTAYKQTYKSLPLNYSSDSYDTAAVSARATINPHVFLEAEYETSDATVASKNLKIYKITGSTATLQNWNLRGGYCWLGNTAFHQLCGAIDFGMDNYPTLNFKNSTDIKIETIQDTTAGLTVDYQYPALPKFYWINRLSYAYGLQIGQNSTLRVNNNSKIVFKTGAEWLMSPASSVVGNFVYEDRTADVKGPDGISTADWTTEATGLGFNIGYRYTFGSHE